MAEIHQTVWNLVKIAVILYTAICGVEGNACGFDECSTPPVNGGGTPTFTPASTCYSNGINVSISCSGILFGQPEHICIECYYLTNYPPACEEYYCPQPASPEHGFEIEPVDEYVLYDVVSFSCDDGFVLGGAQSIMCTGSGDWQPSNPTCHESCSVPYVANGYADFAPGTSLHHQDQVNVSCDNSFTLAGVDRVMCRDGTLDPPIGQCFNATGIIIRQAANASAGSYSECLDACTSKCLSPTIPNSDSAVDRGDIDHGEYVIVTCDAGYTFGLGSDYSSPLTCNNGTWDSALVCSCQGGTCGFDECSTPPVIGGGTPTFTPASTCYSNGINVSISCSGILFGQSEHTCMGCYYYTPSPPTCEEYYCPQPTSPDHGFEIEPVDEYVLYDVVSFSCDDGFVLGGAQSVMCTGSGNWQPSIPTCDESCSVPYVANGYADFAPGTSLHHQDQVNVSCDNSFTLAGVDMVTCRDGTWDPPIGQCFSKCLSPIIPNSDSAVDQGDIDQGEYVIVTCDAGYTFGMGSDYSYPLTCNNGTWDSALVCYANCERPSFPDSIMITPGPRIGKSHYHNDVITVSCAPDHVVSHGPPSASMSCDNRYWTPTMLPICKHVNDAN